MLLLLWFVIKEKLLESEEHSMKKSETRIPHDNVDWPNQDKQG